MIGYRKFPILCFLSHAIHAISICVIAGGTVNLFGAWATVAVVALGSGVSAFLLSGIVIVLLSIEENTRSHVNIDRSSIPEAKLAEDEIPDRIRR
jgi:hypothetical protein